MENRAHALATGLFALFLGCVLVLSLWWFSEDREPKRDYILVSSGSVNGLNVQARVRYRGIQAGNVQDIGIDPENPRNILVRIRIRADLPLTRGTRATLGTQGVTGLAYVQLDDRGTDPALLVGDNGEPPRLALEAGIMEQIADSALAAAERFKHVTDRIAELFSDGNAERLQRSLARLDSAIAGIDRTFADAPATLAAIRSAFSADNVASLKAVLANLEQASGETAPAVAEVRVLLARLTQVAERVDQAAVAAGNGLADDTLPQINGLLNDLSATSRRLGRLIDEVEAAPQVLLTGPAERRPGPGEAGYPRP